MTRQYIIYTDGSTVNNGREGARGGYGVVCLFDRQLDTSGSFSFGNQTNNRYELEGIKKGIDIIRRVNHNHFIIRTDSEYSLKSVTEYVKAWKKNGWKTASGEDVKNKKLIEKIHRYVMMLADRGKIVKFEHVKGHGTDEFNIEADRLARAAATGSDAIHEEISSDEEDFYYTPITHSYDVDVEAMQAYFAKQLQLHVDHLSGANKNLEEQAEKSKPYIIYVKSSIAYHTGKARCGYAVVCVSDRDKDAYGYFQHGKQTKERYELEGFFVATEMARTGKDMYYIFKCDSQDTLKMITESLEIWKQNDWKTSSGEPVQHRGLLQSIDRNLRKLRSDGVKIEFKHVRGNGMDYYNNIADELAQIGGNNNPVDTGEVVPAGLYQPICL
ncbi:hypothetical protein CAEBREN_24105 [Caenorhabditis brenneri]|uniref:RNase H type-1 domain-containing protein n=1 Tax=Caenorhabditis brenneri TaxID=135651 RepID=G0MZ39_CAEBE|nr:hypothetical protein CAEBREN_24105 [Caenorhabditis brenneri]